MMRRYHLLAYHVVKGPFALGGLGIKSLTTMNEALFAK